MTNQDRFYAFEEFLSGHSRAGMDFMFGRPAQKMRADIFKARMKAEYQRRWGTTELAEEFYGQECDALVEFAKWAWRN